MNKQLEKLFNQIAAAQVAYHITGAIETPHTLSVSHTTKAGTTIAYNATRDYSMRGLSYTIRKCATSIAKGHSEEYLGYTHPFGRENVNFIERRF